MSDLVERLLKAAQVQFQICSGSTDIEKFMEHEAAMIIQRLEGDVEAWRSAAANYQSDIADLEARLEEYKKTHDKLCDKSIELNEEIARRDARIADLTDFVKTVAKCPVTKEQWEMVRKLVPDDER